MSETISRQTALRRILANGIEPVLLPAGFEAATKRTWVRREPELLHLIVLGSRNGSYGLEWGIVSPEATEFLWGHPARAADMGDVVLQGDPGSVRWPAPGSTFTIGEKDDSARIDWIAGLVAQDMGVIAAWLGQFQTRRQLRTYLLEYRESSARRAFIVGSSRALRLYIAAVLGVLDRDSAAIALADEAEDASRPWKDPLNRERARRLKAAVATLG
jgi:hypothetical protein